MHFKCLLAKSPESEKTLVEHTQDVLQSAKSLFGDEGPTRLGRAWLRFFGIAEDRWPVFSRLLRVSAAAHDWGKANDGFQSMVRREGVQAVWHEHLSALLLAQPGVANWLVANGIDAEIVISAVLTHHLRVMPDTLGVTPEGDYDKLRFLGDHPDHGALLEILRHSVGAEMLPRVEFPKQSNRSSRMPLFKELRKSLSRAECSIEEDPDRRRMLHAVRAALIAADAAGSAITRMPQECSPWKWIEGAFASELTGGSIRSGVIDRRRQELEQKKRQPFGFTKFQEKIAEQGPRTLLIAPCGSGKTLAAWNWIAAQLDRHPAGRAIFLYPTRATATEGFRDYVSWAPEAALMHGTSAYELETLFDNASDDRGHREFGVDPRLFALGFWPRSIFSATVDQFLAFMQYSYGPMCMLPALADSVVVIDEVHSFDRGMFAALKRFLKEFPNFPVLCMSATVPKERRRDLVEECGLNLYDVSGFEDLKAVADGKRYRVRRTTPEQAQAEARKAFGEGKGRVLWVANRVAVCQEIYEGFREVFPDQPVLCYHSRFRLEDRKARHGQLVDVFRNVCGEGEPHAPAIGVTTQVCEMSLDLDADTLITELAPISALIQRMGRCHREYREGRLGEILIIEPGSEKPYDGPAYENAMRDAREFAKHLESLGEISQNELEQAFLKYDTTPPEPDRLCSFLDSGFYARSGQESFRDVEEFAILAILDEDVEEVKGRIERKEQWDGYRVPVPIRFLKQYGHCEEPGLPKWLWVAPRTHYRDDIGFCEEA